MLSQKHRFHRRNHVKYVYKKGQTVRGSFFQLSYITGQEHEVFRAGVVVSKKVAKQAVARNRIRRRVYEVIRRSEDLISNDVDLILTVYNDKVAEMPSEELTKTVRSILTKAKLR